MAWQFRKISLFLTVACTVSGCANTAYIIASKDGFEAQRKGNLPLAETCFKKAFEACKADNAGGTIISAETNLARVYFAEKKYDQAALLLEDVCKSLRKQPANGESDHIALLNMLGQSEQELKKYDKSEAALNEALTRAQNESGDNGPDIAKTLVSLGGLYKTQAKWEKALDSYQRGEAILNRSANISDESQNALDKNIAEVSQHTRKAKQDNIKKRHQ